MAQLIVSAAGSPLFKNFLMLVSVSDADGKPVTGLKPGNFKVHHLASLNHASANDREVTKAGEGPEGFYTLTLKPESFQPELPPGHYVLAVAVKRTRKRGEATVTDHGQTVAVGDIPK